MYKFKSIVSFSFMMFYDEFYFDELQVDGLASGEAGGRVDEGGQVEMYKKGLGVYICIIR